MFFGRNLLDISRPFLSNKKTGLEGGRKSCGAVWNWIFRKNSVPLSVPIEKRVHPYLFRFRKRVHPYLFRLKKECKPICSALKNDAGQPGPHLYIVCYDKEVQGSVSGWFKKPFSVISNQGISKSFVRLGSTAITHLLRITQATHLNSSKLHSITFWTNLYRCWSKVSLQICNFCRFVIFVVKSNLKVGKVKFQKASFDL